jgi:hypothetical protein
MRKVATTDVGLVSCAPRLAFAELRRVPKAPLHLRRNAMNRTDSDRAGLPVGLELSRDGGKERGPLLVVDTPEL